MEERVETMDLTGFTEKIGRIRTAMSSVLVGQERTVDLLLTVMLAKGHVLIEGVPGIAKTLMARLMAQLVDARFSRIQFTPDLMPSDVLGTSVFNMKTSDFRRHRTRRRGEPRSRQDTVRPVRGDGRTTSDPRRNNV